MNFPLYTIDSTDKSKRVNFRPDLYKKLKLLATHADRIPDEYSVFDYIYGVLHCPEYRKRYRDLLKRNFPRIPWPSSQQFWDVADKGRALRELHLLRVWDEGNSTFPFHGEGNGVVHRYRFDNDAVWINGSQRFVGVPENAWNFFLGGYQPAQKWLKDRRGRALTFDEIVHYQRLINILVNTDKIMKTIIVDLE